MLLKTVNTLVALLLFAAGSAHAGTLSVVSQSRWVEVDKVFDGDTFRTTTGEKIRLLGINTPEVAHNEEPGQPLGGEAKRLLEQLISGKTVRLKTDRDMKDSYDRTLAQIYLRNGIWINEQLLRSGMAHVYTFAPNFRWSERLLKAEAEARNARRGIWKTDTFAVLDADNVTDRHIGQFHLIRGEAKTVEKWRFQLGKLTVTVPRSSRKWFRASSIVEQGQLVMVRGKIRTSSNGGLFLALHSPYDLE
ncbi:Endonuclease YncB, thermonuclease family [Mariprofundus ferrinatatus]|uniref:Endonuclease YncB, thermonuclease family n=1 Tax=Mariprofundus ferrinatatus TaxID=1921087 RepID=A0A2K8L532_9PROT|nr:thermonuclease family protein [Mariprofundus ferrinatatus]ATX82387.1 Endonuclease YncB, thermonuclease family [Mariprofundus ferrinatatus]